MRKIKTFFNVELPYLFGETWKIFKILFWQAVIILVALGILYITNFKISIEPRVETISPIIETGDINEK